jgi:hypothetical protein
MKKQIQNFLFLFISLFLTATTINAQAYEYKLITSVESIVPMGIGRSRIIAANDDRNYKDFTTTRSENDDEDRKNKSDRSDIRLKDYEETKLLNFYNIGGIRFQNIAANDAVISSKINTMIKEGWELAFVNTGVESDAGKDDGQGIFITRYIFRRLSK